MRASAFEGRAAFQQAVGDALVGLTASGCREVHVWDESFVDWPWSEPAVLSALTAWARPGRQLHLLALQYDDLMRRHPLFVRWRRDYGHCVTASAVDPEMRLADAPQALLLAVGPELNFSLRLFDRRLWRGESSLEAAQRQRGWEWFDAVAQRSSPSFASTTLGL